MTSPRMRPTCAIDLPLPADEAFPSTHRRDRDAGSVDGLAGQHGPACESQPVRAGTPPPGVS